MSEPDIKAILEASDRDVAKIRAEFHRELIRATIVLVVFLSVLGAFWGWHLNAR